MVVMLHQDRNRLRELCEWVVWRVVDGAASSAAVSVEASDARLVERDLMPKPVPAPLTEEKLRLLDRLAAIPVSTGGEPDQ
jgi:hypothetical protein